MAKQKQRENKEKKWFIISLIVWLGALPFTAIAQIIIRFLLTGSSSNGAEATQAIVNIFSILLGLYGLLGWIPTVVLLIMWQSKK